MTETESTAIAFTCAPGRRVVPGLKLLEGYRGIVQSVGYAANEKIAAVPGDAITRGLC
ncbi:hypothetical protein [Bradyrhizobium tunisiense]|uniref:hypothetical protein n=1 Tax=Bradyrhizobium tunisiense TaxID=3278709 RepID=UPI0035E1F400